jgi:hypothetical protein
MPGDLTLDAIPLVLDDDEVPFVLGIGSDARPGLSFRDAEYRRGSNRVIVSWKVGSARLQAIVINADGVSYLIASAGPILNEWWPLLRREGGNPARPLLTAAVAGEAQSFKTADLSITVSILPPSPEFSMTTAVLGIERAAGLTDNCLVVAHMYSLGVIKAALLVLGEYRSLLASVPDMTVEAGFGALPLAVLLDAAAEAAAAIAWRHAAA